MLLSPEPRPTQLAGTWGLGVGGGEQKKPESGSSTPIERLSLSLGVKIGDEAIANTKKQQASGNAQQYAGCECDFST